MGQIFAGAAIAEITRLCHSGYDSQTLRQKILQRLATIVPFEYVYFSITDPGTQLIIDSVMPEQPPSWMMSVFVNNEYLDDDFNKFSEMMRLRQPVAILSEAAGSDLSQSARYRNMLLPLNMRDELRAVFATEDTCWGTLCLHRGGSLAAYQSEEFAILSRLTPHITAGLRKAFLLEKAVSDKPNGPALLLLDDEYNLVSLSPVAAQWLEEIAATQQAKAPGLPLCVRSVAAQLRALELGKLPADRTPSLRLRTRAGGWLKLHASRLLNHTGNSSIVVILEKALPDELFSLIAHAHGLTRREAEVTQCVLWGLSTEEIARHLHLSQYTVQDHLKAIFNKVDVNSRRELTARLSATQMQHPRG
ncbi:MAG: hypothetical protein KDE34_04635 [Anaerolineales bacterium]|nr:hypothetical protein [Anaerolineales bacterium]MCB8962963.1 LuxR family transcriptional regulator [Ardenticatenales bacterium]